MLRGHFGSQVFRLLELPVSIKCGTLKQVVSYSEDLDHNSKGVLRFFLKTTLLGNTTETGISRDLQRIIIKFCTCNRRENWVEAETGWTSTVPIYWWSTHPLNNTGVLLTGSCLIIGKGTWCARRWEPMGGDIQKNNQWEGTLRRTTNGNVVKEADKQTFDSLGLWFGLCNCVLAVV
jgi:hypothetical protein